MIDDFKPVRQSTSSDLRNSLDNLSQTGQNKNTTNISPQPDFRTPEESAAADMPEFAPAPHVLPGAKTSRLKKYLRLFVLHWPPHKKEYISAALIVVLMSFGGFLALTLHHPQPAVVAAKP